MKAEKILNFAYLFFVSLFIWLAVPVASSAAMAGSMIWRFPMGSFVTSSPAIGYDGTLYVGSGDGNLYALNSDGTQRWEFPVGSDVISSPTVGSDATIYVGSDDGNLYALNSDGTQKWTFSTDSFLNTSPAIGSAGTIYVGTEDGKLHAINPDGTSRWTFAADASMNSSPAIGSDGTLYVGSGDGNLYAINPDGSRKWMFSTGDVIYSSPGIDSEGTIYIGSGDGTFYAINPDGTRKWTFLLGGMIWSSPAIGFDGTIYVGSRDNNLYAINPDGTLRWSFVTEAAVDSSPAIGSNGTIYVGSNDGNLYAINPDGSRKWSFPTGSAVASSPAIGSDGTIFVGSGDRNLYAIEGSSGGLAIAPWPKFQHDNMNTGFAEIFTLTVSSTAGGSVTVPGEGIYDYSPGTAVDLVATPDSGYCFVNWTGDVANANSTAATIMMNADRTVTAIFDIDTDSPLNVPDPIVTEPAPDVTQSSIDELVNQLENDQITGISDLEGLATAITLITDHFDLLLDQVKDLASDDPVRTDALNTAVETAERLFEQQLEAMQPLMNTDVSAEEITILLDNTGEIAQAMIASGIPLTQTMLESSVAISELAFQTVLDDVLADEGMDAREIQTMIDSSESTRVFLSESSNLNLLDELVSLSGVAIGTASEVERDAISQQLMETGFPDSVTDAVVTALPEVMNADIALLEVEGQEPRTLLDLLDEQLSGTSTADPLNSVITTTTNADSEMMTYVVSEISVVPEYVPGGMYFLPDGTILGLQDNFAVRLAPASADCVALAAEMAAIGLIPEFRSDGRLILSNAEDSVQYVVNIGWSLEGSNTFLSAGVSLSLTGSNPGSENYAFRITYEDGLSQSAVPMIMAKDSLLQIFEANFTDSYALNLQSGVLDLTDVGIGKYKADWAFETLSSFDFAAIRNAGGLVVGDIAFEADDYNDDGVIDLRYYSSNPMGRQILYGLSE